MFPPSYFYFLMVSLKEMYISKRKGTFKSKSFINSFVMQWTHHSIMLLRRLSAWTWSKGEEKFCVVTQEHVLDPNLLVLSTLLLWVKSQKGTKHESSNGDLRWMQSRYSVQGEALCCISLPPVQKAPELGTGACCAVVCGHSPLQTHVAGADPGGRSKPGEKLWKGNKQPAGIFLPWHLLCCWQWGPVYSLILHFTRTGSCTCNWHSGG